MDIDESMEYVPHAGDSKKKKKKKKKRRRKSNDAPEYDPHLEIATASQDTQKKQRPKRKRKTMFEMEDHAPDVKMASTSSNGNSRGVYSGSKRKKEVSDEKDGKSEKKPRKRRPKSQRPVQTKSRPRSNAENVSMWESHEKQYNKMTEIHKVLEDKSGDDEEEKMMNDLDFSLKHNFDDQEDIDVFDDDDDRYTPITLKRKPTYGKNGVFEESEMLNVFQENEENKNEFMFIQMPPVLPLISHLNENEKRDLAKFKKVKQGLLRQIGEGQIGTIRVRKSGKAEFVIGDLTMDINFASPMDSYQQVMHIHCENSMDGSYKGKSQLLGHVPPQNNLVCSYRAKDLLK